MTALAKLIAAPLRTTAFRLAALTVAAFLVAAAVIAGLLFWKTNEVVTEQVIAELAAEATALTSDTASGGLDALKQAVTVRSQPPARGLYFLADAEGHKLAGNMSRMPPEIERGVGGIFSYASQSPGSTGDASHMAVGVSQDIGGAHLVVGRDIEPQRALASRVRRIFVIGFGLLSLAGLAGGIAMSRMVMRRVEDITETSRSIMAGDLSRRMPVIGDGDEFDELSQSLNVMLERIEQLMLSLREVSDNIAHDLKTPLTRLRNKAEAALMDPRGSEAYKDGLERTIEEADGLIRTFNALLLIARLEAGAVEESATAFDLSALVRDVAELYEPVADEAGLALSVDPGAGVQLTANRQLVGQAIANLIDNAIKYGARATSSTKAGARGSIHVGVAAANGLIEIRVADTGPGISEKDRERVLKRFVRLEESRTRPGTGLGLSLVAAVVRLHGGTIRLEDHAPGLRVVLALPPKGPKGGTLVK